MKDKKMSTATLLLRSAKVMLEYLPVGAIFIVLIMTAQGLIPVLNVYLIGKLTESFIKSDYAISQEVVIRSVLIAASLCVDLLFSEINQLIRTHMSFQMEYKLRSDMIKHVEKLDIRYREQSEYHTIISRASEAISPNEMFYFLDMISTVVSAIISLVGVVVLLFKVNMIIPFINLAALVVVSLSMKQFAKKVNNFYEKINESDRKLGNLGAWFVAENTNAEMRVFRSFRWFRRVWQNMYRDVNKKKNRFSAKIELQQGLVNTILTFLPIISILIYLLVPGLSADNIAVDTINIFNSCSVLSMSLVMLSVASNSFSEMSIKYENYFRLFDVQAPAVREAGKKCPSATIELNHAYFRYNTDDPCSPAAVRDFSAKFESGKVYAIVGSNGSGKTTLSKLIMKLYHPCEGTVKMYDETGEEAILRTSTVMQDFMRYDVGLKDNILYGDLENDGELDTYREAIKNGECGSLVQKIGEDTILGTRFGNINLSGGEWQRVAVARGFFRKNSALVVFDEPNASIDAIAESKIIKNMVTENRDKICIFITHRLASVKFADQILVMKEGALIECGTHEELISPGSEYNRMFSAQIAWYQ